MLENLKRDNRASWTDTLMTVTGLVMLVLIVVFVFDLLKTAMLTGLP